MEKEKLETASIANKNDLLRTTMMSCFGQVVVTKGLEEHDRYIDIINKVKSFNDFNDDNDPNGEHDCAFFDLDDEPPLKRGNRYFFKIDYYDESYEYFQKDGNRVLTIGLAEDY